MIANQPNFKIGSDNPVLHDFNLKKKLSSRSRFYNSVSDFTKEKKLIFAKIFHLIKLCISFTYNWKLGMFG